jgi:hypothetical protein
MNKTFTLVFSMIFFLASAGYAFQNRLTISSNSNLGIRVIIDGRTYQLDKNDRDILLSDLRPGNRNIKIYGQKNSGRNVYGNINNEKNMQLLYNGNLYIKDGVDVDVSINRFGKVFVDEQAMNRDNGYDNRYDNRNNNRNDDWDSDRKQATYE